MSCLGTSSLFVIDHELVRDTMHYGYVVQEIIINWYNSTCQIAWEYNVQAPVLVKSCDYSDIKKQNFS